MSGSTLARLRRHALSLEAVTEAPHHDFSSFRVRGKIFVTVPPDGEHVNVFVPDETRERALALHPDCMAKLWWGSKVLGLRVRLARAPWAAVKQLVDAAYAARVAKDAGPPRRARAAR
jgi:hypothetical protein